MRFLVINSDSNHIEEEHNVKHIADKACADLNAEYLNELPIYFVQPTCPVCDSEDMIREDILDETWICSDCSHRLFVAEAYK